MAEIELIKHPIIRLPTEIWDSILFQIPNSSLTFTTRSLIRLLSSSSSSTTTLYPISISHLYQSINISSHHQLKPLLNVLTTKPSLVSLPKTFSLSAWRLLDNYLLINIINLVSSNLRAIDLRIGPVFGPDQLEELFWTCKPKLEALSLRFNQNVCKRSYEPFLKGAYFDSTLEFLAKWPPTTPLRLLSFVQDMPPAVLGEGIAQPIILFRFWCLTTFSISPLATGLECFRLRIPNRNLLPPLTQKTETRTLCPGKTKFKLPISPLPSIEFLDLSTSYLTSVSLGLATILRTYPTLHHLILDRTHLIVPSRFEGDEERVRETLRLIGATVASYGLSRSTDTSRIWREFVKVVELENNSRNGGAGGPRQEVTPVSSSSSGIGRRAKKPGRSAFASGPLKPQSRPITTSTDQQSTTSTSTDDRLESSGPIYNILLPIKLSIIPSPPILRTLSIGTPAPSSVRAGWLTYFIEGWNLGIEKYEAGVQEKVQEYSRNLELWRKQLEPEFETRPRLMVFEPISKKGVQTEDLVQAFFDVIGLRDATEQDTLPVTNLKAPIFCTVPDCEAVGRVVWRPEGVNQVDLIRIDKLKISDETDDDDDVLSGYSNKKEGVIDDDDDDKEEDEKHLIGCGHLLSRKIWDTDYW
ncbi:hypothetical protein CROQUDRAFT_653394 [Cronartium quercuum f. sp. fusiforme G11]|uniref:F-box domain-containing protein n=1 Tax=Cronartium quercuum f. sp. fusiforme G11 TaxID=708437 RepID=A0A9P6NM14_9BASI|nr:hypothetical protein CROQUDRAFT_653394 [Cronartium quercuum f. sp. fusiforme G11]